MLIKLLKAYSGVKSDNLSEFMTDFDPDETKLIQRLIVNDKWLIVNDKWRPTLMWRMMLRSGRQNRGQVWLKGSGIDAQDVLQVRVR